MVTPSARSSKPSSRCRVVSGELVTTVLRDVWTVGSESAGCDVARSLRLRRGRVASEVVLESHEGPPDECRELVDAAPRGAPTRGRLDQSSAQHAVVWFHPGVQDDRAPWILGTVGHEDDLR